MRFLYYLIEIPLIAVAVWMVVNTNVGNNGFEFELWPLESEIQINTKLALCIFLLYGFIWGEINLWFAYSPLRRALRSQKKANKVLNKEQEKLNETVDDLQKNIIGLQEKAKQQEIEYARNNPKPSLKQKIAALVAAIKGFFSRNKE